MFCAHFCLVVFASPCSTNGREYAADDGRRGALGQQLLERIIELEDENRALRSDLITLSSSYTAAISKNNLFQAKILELQARIDVGNNPAAAPASARYRSPLIPTESGAVTYRFERAPRSDRPNSARQHPSSHASGSMSARDHLCSRRATDPTRPAGVSKLILNSRDKGGVRRKGSNTLPVAMASSNPTSVDRIFRELNRSQAPPPPPGE